MASKPLKYTFLRHNFLRIPIVFKKTFIGGKWHGERGEFLEEYIHTPHFLMGH